MPLRATPIDETMLERRSRRRSKAIPTAANGSEITPYLSSELEGLDSPTGVTGFIISGDPFPTYWSTYRDRWLRTAVINNDWAAGALYNAVAKLMSINFRILPRNRNIQSHVDLAAYYQMVWDIGWEAVKEQFIKDILGQDNGGFLEILDAPGDLTTPPDQPRSTFGGFRYHDAGSCQRTSDPVYPVVIRLNGTAYKMHTTRIWAISQMADGRRALNGVGLSAISRGLRNIQLLADISVLFQEYFGSRPISQLVFGAGIEHADLVHAFQVAEEKMDNEGLARFSKQVLVTSEKVDGKLTTVPLKLLPANFEKDKEISLAMYAIAMGFGFDVRELWIPLHGTTKADADTQDEKSKGKTPAWFQRRIKVDAENKLLPPVLMFESEGLADDAFDERRSKIFVNYADANKTQIDSGQIDQRAARVTMLQVGSLDVSEFNRLELADGRLPDGSDVLTLFYSSDPNVAPLLVIPGFAEPLDTNTHEPDQIIPAIDQQLRETMRIAVNASRATQKQGAIEARAALLQLRLLYESKKNRQQFEQDNAPAADSDSEEDGSGGATATDQPGKRRRVKAAQPGEILYQDTAAGVKITTGDVDLAIEESEAVDPYLMAILNAEVVQQ